MKFHKGACGLCKPTKRYKTNATRESQRIKKKIGEELPRATTPSISLREKSK